MKNFLKSFKTAFLIFLSLTFILGVIYPTFIFLIGKIFFPQKANGSLIYDKTSQFVIGSELIGQKFSSLKYFHSRPIRDTNENLYGNNLGPTSQKLKDAFDLEIQKYKKINNLSPNILIPIDAVTSSFSGVDPHISVKNAYLQLSRVAKQRNISEKEIASLIDKYTEKPTFGFLGEQRVNVLLLNIALDNIK